MFGGCSYRHLALLLVAALGVIPSNASSQTTQTLDTQEQRRSARQQEEERKKQAQAPHVSLQKQAAPPVAEDLTLPEESPCFRIDRLSLEVPERLPAHIRAIGTGPFRFAQDYLGKYAGRCIGREGINLIIKRLTARILDKGYTTTRLGIPEQGLSSGVLKLAVVPGVIRSIRFVPEDTPGSWRSAFPARPGDLLNLRDLEQGLEQMKRVPSQDVDMKIVPGKQAGESDVEIAVKRTKPWRLTATLDDSGALSTGKLQAGLNLAVDNPFGMNDLFNIGINNDADNSRTHGTRGSSAYYSVPWGNFTGTLTLGTSYYQQRIAGVSQSFTSSGKSDTLDFKLAWLFHRDQTSKSSLQFRTGKRNSRAFINDTEITVQRSTTAQAELALLHKHNIGKAQLDLTAAYRWGRPWFGGRSDAAGMTPSTPRYLYKLQTLDATLTAPFKLAGKPLSYTGTLRVQNSSTPLYASEWFTIGNRWTVRGFDGENSLGSEKGFFLRNEAGIPLTGTEQTVYLGFDLGKVYGPNVQNLAGDRLAGAAIGMRGRVFGGVNYDMFASWPLYKPQNLATAQPALGISLSYQL